MIKNKIIATLLCVFMITSLFACADKKAPVSFGTNAEPNSLSDKQKQHIIDCYNKSLGEDMSNSRIPSNSFDVYYEHYGNYDGYTILFSAGNITQFTEKIILGAEFFYPSGFSLQAFKDGKFYDLSELAEQGVFSNNTVKAIAEYHESRLPERYKKVYISVENNAAPGTLSEEKIKEFSKLYEKTSGYGSFDNYTVKHYGTYNGCVVFFITSFKTDSNKFSPYSYVLPLDAGTLNYEEYFRLEIYHNGRFKELTASVINDKTLNIENLRSILAYHEQNPFIPSRFEKPESYSYAENAEADSLTDEEKQNIFDWYVYTYDLHNDKDLEKIFWVIRKHYGNYDGYVVLFDRPLGQSTESSSDKIIGGYRFKSSVRFVIRLFKDGKFVTLNDETIEKGLISKEAVGRIWEYHNSIQQPEYKQYDIDIPDNAEPNTLSDETMNKLRAAFKEWAEPRPNVNVDDIVHYGNYDGTAVFFFPDNSIKTPSVYKSPDGITIEHPTYFVFVIYKDGYFDFSCHPSFLQKYLTTESIAEIAAYHKIVSSSE